MMRLKAAPPRFPSFFAAPNNPVLAEAELKVLGFAGSDTIRFMRFVIYCACGFAGVPVKPLRFNRRSLKARQGF